MDINEKDIIEGGDPADVPAPEESEAPRTSLEFEISEEEPGLVFMSETDASFDEKGGLVFKGEADISPEPVAEPEPVTPKEEFSIPDTYVEDDKYSSTSFVEDAFGVSATYVPRFTEVSDTYRMKNDPRPAATISTPTAQKRDEPVLDPTAETVEEKKIERVVVSAAPVRSSEPVDESIKVYKFDAPTEPVSEPEPEIVIPVIPATDTVAEPEPEEPTPAPAPKVLKRPEEYSIPDPEDRTTVVEYEEREEDLSPAVTDRSTKRREFISPAQRDAFKDKFLDVLMSVRFRLVAILLVFACMVTFEVLRLAGTEPLAFIGIDALSYAGAAIDLMFSVCLFALAIPEIGRAFGALARKVVAPELFTVLSLLGLIGYTAVIIADGGVNYLRFGVLFGVQVIVTVIAGLNRAKGDFTAFKIVSRNTHKHVLIKKLTRELPRENMALDGAVDEYNSKTARMFRTAFVNDFTSNTARTVENTSNNLLIMGCALGLSLVTGVVSFFLFDNSFTYAAQAALTVLLLSCPSFSILVHKLPYSCVARHASEDNIAFVGERALYEASDLDVIAYEDTEIFGIEDVSITKVHLYGKVANTAKAMKQMYAIFGAVGGPLDFVFSTAVDKKGALADKLVIEPDGICGTVDGHRIACGSEEYMLRNGITIPSDDYRTSRTSTDSTRVMYGAEDGQVYVKFFIRYSFTEEFTMVIPYLKEQGIVPLVYTRDPNINNALLKNLTMGDDVIRVMKKDSTKTTEEKTYRNLSSDIVTLGGRGEVISIALLARKYTAFQGSLGVTELISMIVGAALATLVAIGGMIDAAAMALVGGLALWQVVWCIILLVRSKITFRISKN